MTTLQDVPSLSEVDGIRRAASRRRRRTWMPGTVIWPLLGVAGFFTGWEVIAGRLADPAVLPAPGMVARNLVDNFMGSRALEFLGLAESSYLGNLRYTVVIVLTAWIAGSILGVAAGVLGSRIQLLRDIVDPVLYVFGVVPVLVAAPFFLIWFGFGPAGQWALVTFFTFVVVAGAALMSGLNVPPRYEEYSATLGLNSTQRLRHIVLPQSAPANVAALRTTLAAAWGLQAIAELMGSQAGVGRVISVRAGTGDVAAVLALIFVLGLVAVIVDTVFSRTIRRVLAWQ
ncbi:ABC transporter permease [Mycolicibacterium vaccae]|uniref:ABC transporter permease n=1 Tax=Mycolicibacterium vaccae TaxID=1810 RepID=UPI003CF9DA4E